MQRLIIWMTFEVLIMLKRAAPPRHRLGWLKRALIYQKMLDAPPVPKKPKVSRKTKNVAPIATPQSTQEA